MGLDLVPRTVVAAEPPATFQAPGADRRPIPDRDRPGAPQLISVSENRRLLEVAAGRPGVTC